MIFAVLLFGVNAAALAKSCQPAPAGFDFRRIQIHLRTKSYDYPYEFTFYFPKLDDACWSIDASGVAHARFDGAIIRFVASSTNDPTQTNVVDEFKLSELAISPGRHPGDFAQLITPPSDRYHIRLFINYLADKKWYGLATAQLPIFVPSDIRSISFIK